MRIARFLSWMVLAACASVFAHGMEPLNTGDMAKLRASYKDRPMLVHIWSLTCAPCLVEMPKWAQRIRQNPNVAFVFINTDGVRHSDAAMRRLAGYGVKPTRSLIYADDFVERLQYEIAPDWLGELPRTEWVSVKGQSLVALGPLSDAQFDRWVGTLR